MAPASARRRASAAGIAIVGALLCVSCGQPAEQTPESVAAARAADWGALIEAFVEAFVEARPAEAVRLGRHEKDGRLPDWSREGLESWVATLRSFRDRSEAFSAAALGPEQRLERRHLQMLVDREIFWLEEAGWPRRTPLFYLRTLDPGVYLLRPYAPARRRLEAYVGFAENLPGAVAQMVEHLDRPLPRSHLEIGTRRLSDLAKALSYDAAVLFRAVDDEELWKRFHLANAAAVAALEEAASGLEQRIEAASIEGYALGPALLRQMLGRVGLELEAEELESAARQDLALQLKRLQAVCSALDATMDPADCLGRSRSQLTSGGLVSFAAGRLDELRRFLESKGLASVPEEAVVRADSAPVSLLDAWFRLEAPGPFGPQEPGLFFLPLAGDDTMGPLPVGAPDVSLAISGEVWPGFFLQRARAREASTLLARTFADPLIEAGWKSFARQLVLDHGFSNDDLNLRVAASEAAILEDARLVAALGLHADRLSWGDAVDWFRESALLEPERAHREVTRVAADPEALWPALGRLALLRLRDDWVAMNTDVPLGEFYDRLLTEGAVPLPILRERLIPGVEGSPI